MEECPGGHGAWGGQERVSYTGAVLSHLTWVLEVGSLAGAVHAPHARAATVILLSPSQLV